jgi:hypothetical protein
MMTRALLTLTAMLTAALVVSGCSEQPKAPETKRATPQFATEPKQPAARWRTRPKHQKPPTLSNELTEAAERAAQLLLEKKYDEALAVCAEFPDAAPLQYLEVYARLLKAHAAGEPLQLFHPTTKREFLEYFLSDDCPNELILALLQDTSHASLAYPLLEVLEQRAEDGILDSTDQLERRMLEILEKNDPTRLRKAVAHALQYWDWDKDKEVFLEYNNALYAVKVIGYVRDPRYIPALREQFEIYRNEKERPLNLMTEALRTALIRLGVRDLDSPPKKESPNSEK